MLKKFAGLAIHMTVRLSFSYWPVFCALHLAFVFTRGELEFGAAWELWAEGQLPSGRGQKYDNPNRSFEPKALMVRPPAGGARQQQQIGAPGSGLSTGAPPSYADPRFIIRQDPYTSITEKLDTSVRDGMVYVNSAYYIMGGSQGEYSVKTPGHRVVVRSFWISPYEVYWKLWNDVLRWGIGHGYRFAHPGRARRVTPLSGLDNPVHSINWFDAIAWCNAYSEVRGLEPIYRYNSTVTNYVVRSSVDRKILSSLYIDYTANGYRLPTEAEWELAARGGVAGKGYLFAGSNREIDVAWYWGNTLGKRYSQPVGLLRPNELGLYDMNGNLAEWTNDWYSEEYYYSSPVDNPLGPGSGKYRVLRGGSFLSRPKQDFFNRRGKCIRCNRPARNGGQSWLAIETRERMLPSSRAQWIGFRPVRAAIFRPVEYLQLDEKAELGYRPVPSTPEQLDNEINDASPYIYSLDPNYRTPNQPYRQEE